MSVFEMKIPSPGESITEVEIASWLVEDGEYVEKDQPIAEIDSDKATLELAAEESGAITRMVEDGDTIEVGAIVCKIDTSVKGEKKAAPAKKEEKKAKETPQPEEKPTNKAEAITPNATNDVKASPVAKAMLSQNNIDGNKRKGTGTGGRITKSDVETYLSGGISGDSISGWGGTRDEERNKMSSLRRKIAQRLVLVKNETAMLTTFNEIDMSKVMAIRSKYKEKFKATHGTGLGFMSFFTKA